MSYMSRQMLSKWIPYLCHKLRRKRPKARNRTGRELHEQRGPTLGACEGERTEYFSTAKSVG